MDPGSMSFSRVPSASVSGTPGAADHPNRALVGLGGVLIAAVAVSFNDQVVSVTLGDIRGALGIGADPGSWLTSLYLAGEVVGMALSPWLLVTFSLRRFTLFAIALAMISTVLIPFTTNLALLYVLRSIEGLAGGFTIPLLMTTALKVTSPSIRLYGLAAYALTTTFTPGLGNTLAALWSDVVGWRFVFFEAIPLAAAAAVLVWYGLPREPSHYERFRSFDWRGAILVVTGFGSLTILLQQGDRLDWFNSPLISVLALLSVIAIPLLLVNEWFHPVLLLKLQLLGGRNFAYGTIALFVVLLIGLSASQLPLMFLQTIQGYRPLQPYWISIEISAAQILMLPFLAELLNRRWVDARLVSFVGLALILAACLGCSHVNASWNRDQFYLWQGLQAIGQPMVVVSLLMIATNSVKPMEGPFASALVNTPRVLAEATGIWLVGLLMRWRGGLHANRMIDRIGATEFQFGATNALTATGSPGLHAPGGLGQLAQTIHQQANVLALADGFLIVAGLTVGLMILLATLPVRTYPPRIQLLLKPESVAHV